MDMFGWVVVEYDVDIVLLEQEDFFGMMFGGFGEVYYVEQLVQLFDVFGVGGGEFDEFEFVGIDGIVLFDFGYGVYLVFLLFLLNGLLLVQVVDDMGDVFILFCGGVVDKLLVGFGIGFGVGFLVIIFYVLVVCMVNVWFL